MIAKTYIILAASASLMHNIRAQTPSKSFLRPENVGVSSTYDFDNMDKRAGHLIEKPPVKPEQLIDPADYVDVEAYDAALMKQMGSESLIA